MNEEQDEFIKQMNEGSDEDVKRAAEAWKKVKKKTEDEALSALFSVPVHTSDWIDKDTMLVFHPGQVDAMRAAFTTTSSLVARNKGESMNEPLQPWDMLHPTPPPDADVACAKEGAYMCERARKKIWELNWEIDKLQLAIRTEEKKTSVQKERANRWRAQQQKGVRMLESAFGERNLARENLRLLKETHLETCRKHDVLREKVTSLEGERDVLLAAQSRTAAVMARAGTDEHEGIRKGSEVWDSVTGAGPYRVISMRKDSEGRISLYSGRTEYDSSSGKQMSAHGTFYAYAQALTLNGPRSWVDRNMAKLCLLAGSICGSAILIHGVLAVREMLAQ